VEIFHEARIFEERLNAIWKEDEEIVAIDSALAGAVTNYSPLLTTVGVGGLAGFLIGFAIKKVFKILAIVAGVFFAVLIYLEQQGVMNINWDKINGAYHGVLSTVTNTIANSTAGVGGSHTTASFLPTLTNLGIPLTGSMAAGFAIGFLRSWEIQIFSFLKRHKPVYEIHEPEAVRLSENDWRVV
jgi:uncharacterized membrane protein (Fun14 family)